MTVMKGREGLAREGIGEGADVTSLLSILEITTTSFWTFPA